MKILVNKTFNTKCFAEYLNTTMKPNSKVFTAGEFKIYADAVVGTTAVNGTFTQVLFAPKSYLDVIDALNLASYNNTLNLGAGYSFDLVMNTLYSGDKSSRDKMVDYLTTQGLITSTQSTQIKNLVSTLGGFVPANIVFEYTALEDVYSYSYATPVELTVPYNQTNNVGVSGKEKLYLVVPTLVNIAYGNVTAVAGSTGSYSPLHTFFNPVLNTTVKQSSYIATELGDITLPESDIKYDHMDRIDYIDSFRLRFKLPRVIA